MKKMRKLIPAFAMLLVSAIMMSTASFAWFTMNDNVQATGMSVQAKASGTLVIKADTKLTLADALLEAKFDSRGTTNLTPITYDKDEDAWYYCGNTKIVDPLTGKVDDSALVKVNGTTTHIPAGGYVDYVVYIASAGEVMRNKQLVATVQDLAAAKQTVSPAYTVAFYFGEITITETTVPHAVINVLNGSTQTVISGTNAVEIPSTVGIEDEANAVGLKVTMRIFVDGALEGPSKPVYNPIYEAATGTFDKDVTYYNADKTLADTAGLEDGVTDISTKGFYTLRYEQSTQNANYVNNADAPKAPTALTVTFTAIDYVAPAPGGDDNTDQGGDDVQG